jgi:hypothetical protein
MRVAMPAPKCLAGCSARHDIPVPTEVRFNFVYTIWGVCTLHDQEIHPK